MSWTLCKTTKRKARQEYSCDASQWLLESGHHLNDFDFSDRKIIAKAIREGFKILPGTEYLHTKGVWEGEWCENRCRCDIDAICYEYG